MSKSFCVRFLFILCCFCFVSMTGFAQSFQTLELTPVNAVNTFENAVRYEITYWIILDGKKCQVFPPRSEKEKDFDLILAEAVRRYTQDEYFSKGLNFDESEVKSTSAQEIVQLVGADSITPAWGKGNRAQLEQYLRQHSNFLKLNKLVAYLDYIGEKGDYGSGLDIDPVLFKFGATPDKTDEVSFIQVRTPNN